MNNVFKKRPTKIYVRQPFLKNLSDMLCLKIKNCLQIFLIQLYLFGLVGHELVLIFFTGIFNRRNSSL